MNILIISAQPPSPYSGGEIRLLNLVKNLSRKHQFTVIAPIRKGQPVQWDVLRQYCKFVPVWLSESIPPRSRIYYRINGWRQTLFDSKPRLVNEFSSPLIKESLSEELANNSFDLIQIQELLMVQYLPVKFNGHTVLDVENLWTRLLLRDEIAKQLINGKSKTQITHVLHNRIDHKKIARYEKRALKKFDACLAISIQEEQTIRKTAPKVKTAIIPNGVDCQIFSPQPAPENTYPSLLFTGTMDWGPNADGAVYFAKTIFPRILLKKPQAIFQIVGRKPNSEVLALANLSRISVTGFVEDVRPYMTECSIFVVPLRAGSGTRLKILEAMAMGKAIVTTSIGCEGLLVENRKHLIIADTPQNFADAVLEILDRPELARKLGENGRQLVETQYDWRLISKRLEYLYQHLATNGSKKQFYSEEPS